MLMTAVFRLHDGWSRGTNSAYIYAEGYLNVADRLQDMSSNPISSLSTITTG